MNFTVLQWNIWYKEKIENILETLKSIDADVVCLQELSIDNPEQSVQDTVAYIAEGLGFNVHSQVIALDNNDMRLANAIFSRFPLSDQKSAWINEPTGTGKYDDQYRAYVEACVKVEGHAIKIGTVHMSYTQAFESTSRKLQETDKLLECIKDDRSRFVLTGDFNAQPDSEVIQKIKKHINPADPALSEKTWTTKPFHYDGFKADTLDWRLDYVFKTDDINVLSSEVIPTQYSDHLPILVKLEIS